MIFTDRKITIRNGKSSINEPVILYRGDFEVSIRFTIMESKFRFKSGVNLVDSEKASFGQLAILAPYGGNVFSEVVKCEDGTVTFTLTKEMIDQLEEVGLYSFQIRLFDYYRESRVSIPPVEFGIEVREPVASEDHDNSVNNAIVGYSIAKVVDGINEDVGDTFDANGNYNKTNWETGDRITEGKLNKIEDALDKINKNEKADAAALDKRITSNYNVLDSSKADKNEIFSMANMGQDVKEAMTGGSVAVVGKNAVLNDNIVDGQISINKLDPLIYANDLDMYKWDMTLQNGQNFIGYKSKRSFTITNGNTINVKNLCVYTRTKRIVEVCIYDGSFVSEIKKIDSDTLYEDISFVVNKNIDFSTARFIIGTSHTEMVHIPTTLDIQFNGQTIDYIPCDVYGNNQNPPIVRHFDNALATATYVDEIAHIDDGEITIDKLNDEFFMVNKNWDIYGNMGNVNSCACSPTFIIPSSYFGDIKVGDIVTVEYCIQSDEAMLSKVESYCTYLITSNKNSKDSGVVMNETRTTSVNKTVNIKHNHTVTKDMMEYIHIIVGVNLNSHGFVHNISKLKVTINDTTYNINSFGYIYGTDTTYIISENDYLPNQFVSHSQLGDISKPNDKWLYGKRWGVLGDSLSDPIYTREYNYFTYISRKYNMEVDNQAKSGASLLNEHGCFKQLADLNGEFDLITCWIGTNDYNYNSTQMYGDKIEELINNIITKYPHTRIMFISPANNLHVNGLDDDINRDNSMYQYVLELQKRCLKYSIPVLDLYTNAGFNPHIDAWNEKYYKNMDKCHFNEEGMARLNPIIEEFLLSH